MAGFAIGLVAVLVYQRRGPAASNRQEAKLSGGGRLRLWHASQGTNHVLTFGHWRRLDPYRAWFPLVTNVIGPLTEQLVENSGRNGLCLFYSELLPEGGTAANPPWAQRTIDEHGCRLNATMSRGQSGARVGQVCRQMLEVWPRRAPVFDLVFGGYQASTNDVRLRIANRQPWQGTEWTPEPLPVRMTQGGLRFELLAWTGSREWPQPRFTVAAAEVEQSDWKPYEIWFEDVTGNRSQSPTLCRREPAWRVRARFGRTVDAPLADTNLWTFLDGRLPAPGAAVVLDSRQRVLEGVTARIVAVGGAGVFRFEGSRGTWQLTSAAPLPSAGAGSSLSSGSDDQGSWIEGTFPNPWAALELTGLTPEHHWQIAVADETGKNPVNRGWSSSGGTMFTCDLGEFPASLRGRLKLVVQRLVEVSFTVPPPP